jgi:hypothetical protein
VSWLALIVAACSAYSAYRSAANSARSAVAAERSASIANEGLEFQREQVKPAVTIHATLQSFDDPILFIVVRNTGAPVSVVVAGIETRESTEDRISVFTGSMLLLPAGTRLDRNGSKIIIVNKQTLSFAPDPDSIKSFAVGLSDGTTIRCTHDALKAFFNRFYMVQKHVDSKGNIEPSGGSPSGQ